MKKWIILIIFTASWLNYAHADQEYPYLGYLNNAIAKSNCDTMCRQHGAYSTGKWRLDTGSCRSAYAEDCSAGDIKYYCTCTN